MSDIYGTSLMVTSALGDAGPQFNTRAVMLTEELQALKTKLMSLFGDLAGSAAWKGMSYTEYSMKQAEWDAAALEMFGDQSTGGLLGEIARILNVNYDSYGTGENSCTASWRR